MVQQWSATQKSAGIAISGTPPLVATQSSSSGVNNQCYATEGVTSASVSGTQLGFYWEIIVGSTNAVSNTRTGIGNTGSTGSFVGQDASDMGWNGGDGSVWQNGGSIATWATYTNSNNLSFCLDVVNNLLYGRVGGGNWNNSGTANPATHTGGLAVPAGVTAAAMLPGVSTFNINDFWTARFARSSWTFSAPSLFGPFDPPNWPDIDEPPKPRRTLWRRRQAVEEFLLNPTQTVFKPWGFEEEARVRRIPRRSPWTARNIDPNEFILNPTQTVFKPWGFDEEQHKQERRIAWRSAGERSRDEFIQNPTQQVFAPWGLDEEQHKQERAIPRRAPQQEDPPNPPVVSVEPWAFDGDARRPILVSRQRCNDERTEGLAFTAATPLNWPDIDEPPKLRRQSVQRRQAIEEFLFNPTQISFVSWAFDEEAHRQQRRVFHRALQQEDPLGIPQLVGVPWSFDEEQRRAVRWARNQPHAAPTDNEGLPFTAATPLTWADIEQSGRRRIPIIGRRTQADDLLPVSVAGGPYAWGFEEEPQRGVPRRPRRKPRADDLLGFAFSVVGTETIYYEEEQRAVPRRPRRKPRTDDLLGFAFQVVGTETIYYDEEPQRAVPRARVWHARPQPNDLLPAAVAAPVVYIEWGDELQHLRPRRFFFNRTRADEWIGALPVGVPWGFEEEQHRLQRRIFRRLLQQEDPIGFPQLVGVPLGFEEEPQHAVPRRYMWRARPRPDDTGGFPFTASVVTYVEWGEEAQHRQPHRLVKARTQPEEWFGLGQLVGTPWIYDEDSRRIPRTRWHGSPKLADNEGLPFTVVVTPLAWADIDELPKQRRRIGWRARPRPADNEGWPFNVTRTVFVEWADEPARHRVLRVWRARPQPNDISGFSFLVPTPPLPLPTLPDGRWRSVIAPGESSINDNNYLSPVIGEVGFALFFDTTVAFSSLIEAMTLVFTKPSGNQLAVEYPGFFFGADRVAGNLSIQQGYVGYIFGPGDLDEAGLWSVFLARGGSRASGIAHFRVLNPIEGLELAMPN
jgi:hypothetical protein